MLPEPHRERLRRAPLELVVSQIRYEPNLRVTEPQLALQLHEAIGGRQGDFPRLQPISGQGLQFNLAFGSAASGVPSPQIVESSRSVEGWQFLSEDGSWVVSLMPDATALQTSTYGTWEETFRPRFGSVLAAVAEHIQPRIEQRLGLRYVNQIRVPGITSPAGWRPFISPSLLGLAGHDQLGETITISQQQLTLNLGDQIVCNLRHGCLPDITRPGSTIYLLDLDLYRQTGRPFNVEEIQLAADALNTRALQLFEAAVTPALLTELDR